MGHKVCHVSSVHPYWDTRILHREAASLAEAGYDVRFLVIDQECLHWKGVEIQSIEAGIEGRRQRILKAPKLLLRELLKMEDVELVHLHDPELPRIAKSLKKAGKKVIYDAHEDLPRQLLGKPYIPAFLKRIMASMLERYEDRIAEGVGQLLKDPERMEAMGKNGRSAVEREYNWGREEERSLHLYERILQSS